MKIKKYTVENGNYLFDHLDKIPNDVFFSKVEIMTCEKCGNEDIQDYEHIFLCDDCNFETCQICHDAEAETNSDRCHSCEVYDPSMDYRDGE